jgi:hypothetical protein
MQKLQPHSFLGAGIWWATRIQAGSCKKSETNHWKLNPETSKTSQTISQATLKSQP